MVRELTLGHLRNFWTSNTLYTMNISHLTTCLIFNKRRLFYYYYYYCYSICRNLMSFHLNDVIRNSLYVNFKKLWRIVQSVIVAIWYLSFILINIIESFRFAWGTVSHELLYINVKIRLGNISNKMLYCSLDSSVSLVIIYHTWQLYNELIVLFYGQILNENYRFVCIYLVYANCD